MSTIAAYILVPLAIVWMAFCLANCFADLFSLFGNPLARLLGLQDPPREHQPVSKIAKVIELKDNTIRVEFEGSTWFAKQKNAAEKLELDEKVLVEGREGLTLIVCKSV